MRTSDLCREERIRQAREKDQWSGDRVLGRGVLPHSKTELPRRKATSEGRPRVTVAEAQGTGRGRQQEEHGVLHRLAATVNDFGFNSQGNRKQLEFLKQGSNMRTSVF